jgi:hypothetical protein
VVRRQLFILLMLALIAPSALALSKLEASVDRNPVLEGEYFVLSVSADDELDAGKLDTSVLLKDFIVGRTSVSRSTQIINFDTQKETRWQVLLAAKNEGEVTIPAFNIDGTVSNPIALSVAAPGSQPAQMNNLYIETTLSTDEAYVGQLVTYKVKLFLALELQRGVLSAPLLEGAEIKQLGDDKDGSEIVNGKRYRVIERTYGIIADLPGEIHIEGASFSGDVLVESQRRGGMFGFNESRPMQAASEPRTLLINPAPASYQGQWLVADLVVLQDKLADDEQEFSVGSPITRTLTLLASNADETSLPELNIPLPGEIKSYPESPQRQSFVRNGQLVSQLSQTQALVPTQAGTFTLPEISVPWWNPRLRRQEYATVPARTIEVKGAAVTQINLPPAAEYRDQASGLWPWLTLLFACLWLLSCGVAFRLWRAGRPTQVSTDAAVPKPAKMDDAAALQRACQGGNASAILQALQQHCSHRYGRDMTLGDIKALSAQMANAVEALQRAAYSREQLEFNPQILLDALRQLESISPVTEKDPLAPLNPGILNS